MSYILDFLIEFGAETYPQSNTETLDFEHKWLSFFANNVKLRYGVYVYEGFKWHGFSLGLQSCVEGERAINTYKGQWPSKYIIFEEQMKESFLCYSDKYPDLSSLSLDVYVSHANLKWTMVFTHEQPVIGPFFAMRHNQ